MLFKKKQSKKKPYARKLVTIIDQKSIFSEQFKTIRTNISFAMPDRDLKTILVTSSQPGEGKSTIASNMGVVFAQEGKKVLLVDADMRKPTLHYTFNMYNIYGLSNVLSGQKAYEEVINETFVDGLSVMPSGAIPPNPTELLASEKLNRMVNELREQYDMIIFDAPPLLAISDAQILSHKLDGTLLVVNTGETERASILKAKATLQGSQANILGVILNNYEITPESYYYQEYK
nr:CpsD/CapB family tyrosine-protein kinase [Lysinibacillus timonensis]